MDKHCIQELLSLPVYAPEESWNLTVLCLLPVLEDARCLSDSDIRVLSTAGIELIIARLATHGAEQFDHVSLEKVLVDCLRLLLRFREPLSDRTVTDLVKLLCSRIKNVEDRELSNACVRCLLNLTFENESRISLLWKDTTLGADSLCTALGSAITEADAGADLHYNTAKLIFMMLAQCPSLKTTALSPGTASAFAVACAAATCLYASARLGQNSDRAAASCEEGETVQEDRSQLALCQWTPHSCRLYCECAKVLFALGVADVVAARGAEGVQLLGSVVYRTAVRVLVGAAGAQALHGVCQQPPQQQNGSHVLVSSQLSPLGHDLDCDLVLDLDLELRARAEQCADFSLQLLMHGHMGDVYAAVAAVGDSDSEGEAATARESSVIAALLLALDRQLHSALALRSASQQAAILTPALVVLCNVCGFSKSALAVAKKVVFPNPWRRPPTQEPEGQGQEHPQRQQAKGSAPSAPSGGRGPMDPIDAPEGSLRARLLRLMTNLDASLKRCAAEFLFLLCDENADEFTARTGFGNAVALLQIKGLV